MRCCGVLNGSRCESCSTFLGSAKGEVGITKPCVGKLRETHCYRRENTVLAEGSLFNFFERGHRAFA